MKKTLLLTFVLTIAIGATLLTGCKKDSTSTIKTDNYIGTYYGYFTLESLAFSNPALDTVIGKQLPDTLTISENGNTTAILLYGIMQTKEFHRGWVFL